MPTRSLVLPLLAALMVITYIDRVCISVAGPRIQQAFSLTPYQWGWVTGIFTLAYGLFEIPTGALGDRLGARKVLTRIVLWWSAFTALTGLATGYQSLLAIRFLFGVGEAGALPNTGIAIANWYAPAERGRALGIALMAMQIGGALTPFLVLPLQQTLGWRTSFYVFGAIGAIWALVWYRFYRDSPNPSAPVHTHGLNWRLALRAPNFWLSLGIGAFNIYSYGFFQSWFHTFLVQGRGYTETGLLLSSIPYIVAAGANIAGGFLSKRFVERYGLERGRRIPAMLGLAVSAAATLGILLSSSPTLALVLLSLLYGGLTLHQPIFIASLLDIGGKHSGSVIGAMNMAGQLSSFLSAIIFGAIVERTHSWDAPFIPMFVLLLATLACWTRFNASRPLKQE